MTPYTLLLLAAAPFVAAPVPKGDGRAVVVLGDTSPGKDEEENAGFLKEQAKLFKSRKMLKAALRKPGIAGLLPLGLEGDHVGWLQKRLHTEVQPEKHTFRVWVTEIGPRNQGLLLNALADTFLAELTRQHRESIEDNIKSTEKGLRPTRQYLEGLLQRYKRRPTPRLERDIKNIREGVQRDELQLERLRRNLKKPLRIAVVQKAQEKP